MQHTTVLLHEAVAALNLQPSSVVVDATFGAGGHAALIASELDRSGTLVAFDADETAFSGVTLTSTATVHLVHSNFKELSHRLAELNIAEVDGVLADLGWRMDQFTAKGKGFSFADDSGLAMTFGQPEDYLITAADIVNTWAAEDIANVLYGYGEERYSRRIAAAIVEQRAVVPFSSAQQLAEVIGAAVPAHYRRMRTHPATKSFQALRIAVNDELSVLESFIHDAVSLLRPGGRLAIISFHSIEDRIVKQLFRSYAHDRVVHLVNKKPITPAPEELQKNPRARSAKLRIIEKLP